MSDSLDTLGMATGTLGPDSATGMEPTVSAADSRGDGGPRDGGCDGRRAVDLSFLAPSNRCGSLGRLGEYEITGVIGRGAMGVVLKGRDRALNREVAVKVQDPSLALNRRHQARFLKEARAAAAINHPGVVTIYKVNIVRERPFLAMEFVPESLRDRIKGGPPPATGEVLRIALQVAEGLAAAHAKGVLHRDIKPANILLDDAGRVKITDFGLALEGLDRSSTLAPEKVVGTPAYMSPEQVRNEPLDARSDLFSLGCVIVAMLTGRSPFGGMSLSEATASVLHHHPAPPCRSDHPSQDALNALVLRLLSKSPADRPGSAREVAMALKAMLAAPVPEPVPVPVSVVALPAAPVPLLAAPRAARSGLAWLWPVLTLASLALTGFLARDRIMSAIGGPQRPPPSRASWAVGHAPGADFPDLASALASAKVGPGATLRLVDEGRYEGPIVLDTPSRFRDLTIRADRGASLSAATGNAVVTIAGCPGVTLLGLTIEARGEQHAILITGPAEGVTVDRAHLRSPEDGLWTQVFVTDGATGTADRPIVISGSTFEVGHGGVTIQGSDGAPVGGVEVVGNRFLGDDEHVHVLCAVRDVTVAGNVFLGGQAVTLNMDRWHGRDILIANNTFFRTRFWVFPSDSDPAQEGVIICNNAILESVAPDAGGVGLARMARGLWSIHHNHCEPGLGLGPAAAPRVETRPRLEVLSRDPKHEEFLRPSAGSELAQGGAGGTLPRYVGALAPTSEPRRMPRRRVRPESVLH